MQERATALYPRAPIYFSLVLLTAATGFYPSYFSRFGKTDAVHHFHGLTATAWILMLVAQAWLIQQRQFGTHRLIGRISLVLAPLFIISGLLVTQTMLAASNGFNKAFGARLAFVDLTTLAFFAAAYGLAIAHRRNTPLHARYMASTAVLVLPPALARALAGLMPGIHSFEAAFHGAFLLTELVVIALIVDDARQGKIRGPYLALLALTLVQHAGFEFVPRIEWWNRLLGH